MTVPEPVTQTKKRKTQSSLVDSKRFKASLEPVRPTVSFKDIGGTKKVLQEVTQMLIHMRHPEVSVVAGRFCVRKHLLSTMSKINQNSVSNPKKVKFWLWWDFQDAGLLSLVLKLVLD